MMLRAPGPGVESRDLDLKMSPTDRDLDLKICLVMSRRCSCYHIHNVSRIPHFSSFLRSKTQKRPSDTCVERMDLQIPVPGLVTEEKIAARVDHDEIGTGRGRIERLFQEVAPRKKRLTLQRSSFYGYACLDSVARINLQLLSCAD